MKKICMGLLISAMSLLLAACSGSGSAVESERKETNPAETSASCVITDDAYGAVGDGTTDNTEALCAAMEAAEQRDGFVVLPKGTFAIQGKVTVPETVTLIFEKGASVVLAANAELELNGRVEAFAESIFLGEGKVSGSSNSVAYPQWFIADAETADYSTALQKAVDVFATVRFPVSASAYTIGSVTIRKPTVIEGMGSTRVNLQHRQGENMFILASDGITFRNLYITGNGEADADTAVFYFDTSVCSMKDIVIEQVWGINNGYCLKDAEHESNTVSHFRMQSCAFSANLNEMIYITDFTEKLEFLDVVADNIPGGRNITYPGWYMENVTDMFMDNIDAAGGLGLGEGGDGFVFVNCRNVRVDRAMQDYVNGIGLKLVNCTEMSFSNFVCSLYEGYGIYMENVTDSTFDLIKANGIYPTIDVLKTRGVAYETVMMVECRDVVFNNLYVGSGQADGLILEDCSGVTVNSYAFYYNRGKAYIEKGNSDNNCMNGAIAGSNSRTPTFIQIGANSMIQGLVINGSYKGSYQGPKTVF